MTAEGDRWAGLRREIEQDRAYYSRKAAEYASTPGGEADKNRAAGRAAMCDDVLRHMGEGEQALDDEFGESAEGES